MTRSSSYPNRLKSGEFTLRLDTNDRRTAARTAARTAFVIARISGGMFTLR